MLGLAVKLHENFMKFLMDEIGVCIIDKSNLLGDLSHGIFGFLLLKKLIFKPIYSI